jgi:uncharacterized protein with GYD domain
MEAKMATYIMLGKYTTEGVKGASASRTKKIADLIGECGGKVEAMFALLGEYDLAFRVNFPGTAEALKASFNVAKATGITFSAHAAITAQEFDRLMGGIAFFEIKACPA